VPSDAEPYAQPFIAYGKNKDVAPSVSPDGSKTAFQSSSESRESGRWRYDIVIVDSDSKKALYTIVPESDAVLSQPKFIDANRLRFMSFDGQRYKFWEFNVSTGKEDLLGELTPDDIQRAKVYNLPKEAS
jgi:Tol biopolymer transport system component